MKTFTNRTKVLLFMMLVIVQACGILPGVDTGIAIEQPIDMQSTQLPEGGPGDPHPAVSQGDVVPVNLPKDASGHAGDQVSSPSTAVSGGDRFTLGQFERPFNSETMDVYYSSLDIVDTFVYQDDTWIYGVIQLNSREVSDTIAEKYALEFDTNRDGRGDWLVLVADPISSEWTVNGVQIFHDANDDVGSQSAMFSDENEAGDGFESLVFDQGVGLDMESAWVRTSPVDPNVVEISVKNAVLRTQNGFMINMWAGTSLLDPSHFDINDHYTHEQAGAADPGFELYYPIKTVAEIDNSCRMAIDFQPSGNEPGLCKGLIPVNPSVPSVNQSCQPCPEGATSQKPYPDCRCVFPIFQ